MEFRNKRIRYNEQFAVNADEQRFRNANEYKRSHSYTPAKEVMVFEINRPDGRDGPGGDRLKNELKEQRARSEEQFRIIEQYLANDKKDVWKFDLAD